MSSDTSRSIRSIVSDIRLTMRRGCGAYSCDFKKPVGMGTTGGCRCWEVIDSAIRDERDQMRARKDAAYEERNRLVAVLSKLWPSHLAHHPEDDASWSRDWMTIVCIHSPAGQVTWHIHDSHRHLFTHLSYGDNHWDGHTTDEKYARLDVAIGRPSPVPSAISRAHRAQWQAAIEIHTAYVEALEAEIERLRSKA